LEFQVKAEARPPRRCVRRPTDTGPNRRCFFFFSPPPPYVGPRSNTIQVRSTRQTSVEHFIGLKPYLKRTGRGHPDARNFYADLCAQRAVMRSDLATMKVHTPVQLQRGFRGETSPSRRTRSSTCDHRVRRYVVVLDRSQGQLKRIDQERQRPRGSDGVPDGRKCGWPNRVSQTLARDRPRFHDAAWPESRGWQNPAHLFNHDGQQAVVSSRSRIAWPSSTARSARECTLEVGDFPVKCLRRYRKDRLRACAEGFGRVRRDLDASQGAAHVFVWRHPEGHRVLEPV
jgi:hypothetical protein